MKFFVSSLLIIALVVCGCEQKSDPRVLSDSIKQATVEQIVRGDTYVFLVSGGDLETAKSVCELAADFKKDNSWYNMKQVCFLPVL